MWHGARDDVLILWFPEAVDSAEDTHGNEEKGQDWRSKARCLLNRTDDLGSEV